MCTANYINIFIFNVLIFILILYIYIYTWVRLPGGLGHCPLFEISWVLIGPARILLFRIGRARCASQAASLRRFWEPLGVPERVFGARKWSSEGSSTHRRHAACLHGPSKEVFTCAFQHTAAHHRASMFPQSFAGADGRSFSGNCGRLQVL